MSTIDPNLLNLDKSNYDDDTLILGQQKRGIGDSFSGHHPKLVFLLSQLQSQDWQEKEIPHHQTKLDFKVCEPHQYEKMISVLAWQWEADTVVANLQSLMSPFVSSSILNRLYGRIADNENIHWASYSEIVINSFDNPRRVIEDILSRQAAQERLRFTADAYNELYHAGLVYQLGQMPYSQDLYELVIRFLFVNYLTEAVGFGSSFVHPFSEARRGQFNSIGHVLQKINNDELGIHAPVGAYVLNTELSTERGLMAYNKLRSWFTSTLRELMQSEYAWNAANFGDGRNHNDLSENQLNRYSRYLATNAMRELRLPVPDDILEASNPLPWMDDWLNANGRQSSAQEERSGLYLLGNFKSDRRSRPFSAKYSPFCA